MPEDSAKKIRCMVVDDEPPAVAELTHVLSQHQDVQVVGSAGSAAKALEQLAGLSPDVVFLDIQMPGQDGFGLIQGMVDRENPPLIVFVTAYEQYAVQAFEKHAVDYILKPYSEKRVAKSLDRIRGLMRTSRQAGATRRDIRKLMEQVAAPGQEFKRVSVECRGRILLLAPREIVLCHTEERRLMVYTADHQYECYGVTSLNELEKRLGDQAFFRVSRAHLVNLRCIKELSPWFNGRYVLVMSDQDSSEVAVSRSRVRELKERLGL